MAKIHIILKPQIDGIFGSEFPYFSPPGDGDHGGLVAVICLYTNVAIKCHTTLTCQRIIIQNHETFIVNTVDGSNQKSGETFPTVLDV